MKILNFHRSICLLLLVLCTLSNGIQAQSFDEKVELKPSQQGYVPVKEGKLYYQVFGKGPLIILLHGGPGLDQTYLLPQMLELAKNYQVVLYDQRGSGKSITGELSAKVINVPQFVEDLEAIRKHLGQEKFILMGHSWGGFLAMQYAIAHPNHLSSLILLNSGPATSLGRKAFFTELTRKISPIQSKLDAIQAQKNFKEGDPDTIAEFFRILFSAYFYHPSQVQELSLHFTTENSLSVFKIVNIFNETYFAKDYDLTAELKKLKFPTLIIAGSEDVMPVWTEKEIASSIPNSKFVLIDQCGHFPYIEKPIKFFNELEIFLKTVK